MATFKVKALALSGTGKKVFRNGDVVDEKQLLPGAAKAYLKTGHIVAYKATEEEAKENAKVKAAAKAEAKAIEEAEAESDKVAKGNAKAAKAAAKAQQEKVKKLTGKGKEEK